MAMGWFLFYFKLRSNTSGHPVWMRMYRFWVRVFALSFALGVVSGVTMSFQFGTNWPGFMEKVGNVAGPLLGYEVLTAFFLRSHFLRYHAIWHTPGPQLAAYCVYPHRCAGHYNVCLLDIGTK
jgi:Cytochrome bd-type quinol oxidase, subunit 1